MKTNDFQALLLRAAVVAMAADGEIAETEKAELARLTGSTAYFLGFDHAHALPGLLADPTTAGPAAPAALAQAIAAGALNLRQEEALLDVLLRIIDADGVVQPAERALLRTLRPALLLPDAALLGLFPRLLRYLLPGTERKFADR